MTDKERLEDIRAEVEQMAYTSPLNFEKTRINKESALWLIKQAERVEELEEEKDEWKDTAQSYYMTNQELREQNKRYREALEEIARGRFTGASYKARQALEGEKCANL